MIRSMLNLRCDDGHLHFSPTPAEWEGKHCGRTESRQVCREPLSQHRGPELPRISGEVVAVDGPTTLGSESPPSD